MSRGKASADGDVRVAQNGYHYTRTNGSWELTHRLIAEKRLGRKLLPFERAKFVDSDRTNLDPDNIIVVEVQTNTIDSRIAKLKEQIAQLEHEVVLLEEQKKVAADSRNRARERALTK